VPDPNNPGEEVVRSDLVARDALDADQVIVGLNATRHKWNRRIRELKNKPADKPVKDDRLVCLKNRKFRGLFNGQLFNAEKVQRRGASFNIWVRNLDNEEADVQSVKVRNEFFTGQEGNLEYEDKKGTDEFTYGHALTCHKSQGSQWNDVLIVDESSAFREDSERWLYTAITRAAERVTLVV
jgi:exodeoxyribonuclease-5